MKNMKNTKKNWEKKDEKKTKKKTKREKPKGSELLDVLFAIRNSV